MKSKKLWDNGESKLDPIIEAFETGDDLVLDQKLVKYDVLGSLAHAKGLHKIGILNEKECKQLEKGLSEIASQGLTLEPGDEDVHTKIENYLTEKYGEVGKKIHTGRSRNDQVLTAIRLFCKAELIDIWQEVLELTLSFAKFAKKYEFLPMPGFTHMQKAMPSSVGLWAASFVESLLDDLLILKSAYELNNQSPLGSGAGYGVPIELDRAYMAKLLGFDKIQNNSLYVQNSRGKIEASILSSLISLLQTINKFVSDVMLFTSSEFDYFQVNQSIASGSSIMPQKKNVDLAELLRSKVHVVLGNYTTMVSISGNLPSGYNRDLQDSKKPLFESLKITKESLAVCEILVNNLLPNQEVLKKALTQDLFATHQVFSLVKKGMAFRLAYNLVKNDKFSYNLQNVKKILQASSHVGGTGNLGLNNVFKSIRMEEKKLSTLKKEWEKTIEELLR